MITIITFNPAVDKLYNVDNINIGGVQRAKKVISTPGGKGINVAKVCKTLGESVVCVGFLGGHNGAYIKEELLKLGVQTRFTEIQGETRVCLNIVDNSGRSTEILEKGPIISEEDLIRFEERLMELLEHTSILVASGSFLQGIPEDYYLKIGYLCKERGIKFILDTSGNSLKIALKSNPFLIKPNTDELKALTNMDIKSKKDAVKGAALLLDQGATNVCVSLGAEGMILVNRDNVYEVEIPTIEIENTVGSGDASIAGFAYGFLNNYHMEDILKLSNACGMSNSCNEKTGCVNIEEVENFMKYIRVSRKN